MGKRERLQAVCMFHLLHCFAKQHITRQAKHCIVYYVSLLHWTRDRVIGGKGIRNGWSLVSLHSFGAFGFHIGLFGPGSVRLG